MAKQLLNALIGIPRKRAKRLSYHNVENIRRLVSGGFRNGLLVAQWLLCGCPSVHATLEPSTAFFYGRPVPSELLANFEQVVVEPDNLANPEQLINKGVELYAYVSIGEVNTTRSWYHQIPERWFLGRNADWGSRIIDLTSNDWKEYLLTELLTPLWKQGYHGFFLDTLDSYQRVVHNQAGRLAQQSALSEIIRVIHLRFPGIKLIFNRGFEILPQVCYLSQ